MEVVASSITRVFRIQNNNGEGIYVNSSGIDIYSCPSYDDDKKHPKPEDDKLLRASLSANGFLRCGNMFHVEHYSFGFSTIEQLREWFYDDVWLEWMDDNGFHLAEYYVDTGAVMQGDTQCMFVKNNNYDMYSFREYFNLDNYYLKAA